MEQEEVDYLRSYLSDRPIEVGTSSTPEEVTDTEYLSYLRTFLND